MQSTIVRETHTQYGERWRKMYQHETGLDALDAEIAYESYSGMTDCPCYECSTWREFYYAMSAEQREEYWKQYNALIDLTWKLTGKYPR